jgi:predicted DNA binding CopG/RHH family protein
MARKKIKGTKEKLIRLSDETIVQLKGKAAKKDMPVKLYIEETLTKHASK